MLDFFRRKRQQHVALEEQIRVLQGCGIGLHQSVRPESLLHSIPRETLEADPYRLLLCLMGDEAESPSQSGESGYPSDNIWHFDTECIEGPGDYQRIARRMCTLAQGDLPLVDLADFVDVEGGTAWLSFSLDGKPEKWNAKLDDDWVDPEMLSRFARLLESRKAGRRFTCIDLQGQDLLIGCATNEEKTRLEKDTGLKVQWLR